MDDDDVTDDMMVDDGGNGGVRKKPTARAAPKRAAKASPAENKNPAKQGGRRGAAAGKSAAGDGDATETSPRRSLFGSTREQLSVEELGQSLRECAEALTRDRPSTSTAASGSSESYFASACRASSEFSMSDASAAHSTISNLTEEVTSLKAQVAHLEEMHKTVLAAKDELVSQLRGDLVEAKSMAEAAKQDARVFEVQIGSLKSQNSQLEKQLLQWQGLFMAQSNIDLQQVNQGMRSFGSAGRSPGAGSFSGTPPPSGDKTE